MRKFFLMLFVIVFSATHFLFGQKVSNIDFDLIKSKTEDSTSFYFYPDLIQKVLQFDSTMSETEYAMLYYGNVYFNQYNPYGSSEDEDKFYEKYKSKKFEEALPYGEKELKSNPVNLKLIYKVMVCYYNLEDQESLKKYARLYFGMLNEIYKSGDGKSIETAYVVIKVSDEYEIVSDLELNVLSQSLIGQTDKLMIDKKGQKPKKGEKKIKELYFDVSKPFLFLMNQF